MSQSQPESGPTSLADELRHEYALRFTPMAAQRERVWHTLIDQYFQPIVGQDQRVLDLGCGWGEFINQVAAAQRYGMDLNPESRERLNPAVDFLEQDCSQEWAMDDAQLDVVFTSNFFEHLPDKPALSRTLQQAHRCLAPGGKLICMGPNLRFLHGEYWDFFDHHLELTDRSLVEALTMTGFVVDRCVDRFLPYTMVGKPEPQNWQIKLYLKFPWAWRVLGKQFLVVARKPVAASHPLTQSPLEVDAVSSAPLRTAA